MLGWVVFDNPPKLNAVSEDMCAHATKAVLDMAADDEIRVIILRGAGKKAFISGGDISKFEEKDRNAAPGADRIEYDRLRMVLQSCDKPVIAMIYGYCLGGGMGLALAADIRLAAASSRLGIPAAKRGLGYPVDHLRELLHTVGPAAARDIMFSGRQIDGEEAARLGLVNRSIPTESLERETIAYAEAMAENAPLSIRASKVTINELLCAPPDQDLSRAEELVSKATLSADCQEATRAFMEKRSPVFRGE